VVALLLESGGRNFAACLAAADATTFAGLRPGSRLRVTGVAELDRPADSGRSLVSLWLRSPAGVTLISPPHRRIDWPLVLAFGLPGLAGCAGLGWLVVSRQRRWRKIQGEFEASQRGLQDSLNARERMAQDLHDNVMQSVFAVGLGLEDCRRKLRSAPDQAAEQLNAAISSLNGSLREIRRFIGGLEPQAIGGHEFKAALKSLALTIGESAGQFSIEVHPAATSRLTTDQAAQLLNIAKEAMSNSFRHARANKTVVSLQPENSIIRLEVADDGAGFDLESVRDTAGLGLRNIERRARSLGARLQVISAPGHGTRIIVELPQSNL
jgi:signal transduction histidine kinase